MAGKSVSYDDDLNAWLQNPENAAQYLTAILEVDALLLVIRDVAKAQGGMAAVAEHPSRHGAETESYSGALRQYITLFSRDTLARVVAIFLLWVFQEAQ